MNIGEVIAKAKKARSGAIENDLYFDWINTLEGRIQVEIMGIDAFSDNYITYENDDVDRELLVKSPYDNVYIYYLMAMTDLHNEEFDKYSVDSALFDDAFSLFSKQYHLNSTSTKKSFTGWY